MKSIYSAICNNIVKKELPDNFRIDSDENSAAFRFAPGALDGICLRHSNPEPLNAKEISLMAKAIKEITKNNYEEAHAVFCALCQKKRALIVEDPLLKYIIRHESSISAESIYNCAVYLIFHSSEIECVKIGLILFEILSEPNEEIKKAILRLALYEEFTLFALWAMQNWKYCNTETFTLAQKLKGWGKIHAVHSLEVTSDWIKRWILLYGTQNYVLNSYSALTCWKKSEADGVLFGEISKCEYDGISTIIDGLLNEEASIGISALDNKKAVLMKFLEKSKTFDLTPQNYEVLRNLKEWAEDAGEDFSFIAEECGKIINCEPIQESKGELI